MRRLVVLNFSNVFTLFACAVLLDLTREDFLMISLEVCVHSTTTIGKCPITSLVSSIVVHRLLPSNTRNTPVYHSNPPHRLMEEWDSKGVYVNYWETDCNFIQIPWELKRWWQLRLKDVVQEWAGVEIEQTDLYGMRQYEAGARLLTHVDRINTHAVSLIVNIAQGNLTQPWTVEVYDHADRLHEVQMEPGSIVYYESAKALHGRNTPLAGGYYANLFTHYRPIGDPEWYLKENPEGTPEPLMDVGKCELVGKPNEYSSGAVKCENDAIGPHLSPSMFKAASGDDLYNWWLSVGPKFDDEL